MLGSFIAQRHDSDCRSILPFPAFYDCGGLKGFHVLVQQLLQIAFVEPSAHGLVVKTGNVLSAHGLGSTAPCNEQTQSKCGRETFHHGLYDHD